MGNLRENQEGFRGEETRMEQKDLSPETLKNGVEIEYHKVDYSDEGSISSGLRFYTQDERGNRVYLGGLDLSEYGLARYHGLEPGTLPTLRPEEEDRIRIQTILNFLQKIGLRLTGDGVNEYGVPFIESKDMLPDLKDVLRWRASPKNR